MSSVMAVWKAFPCPRPWALCSQCPRAQVTSSAFPGDTKLCLRHLPSPLLSWDPVGGPVGTKPSAASEPHRPVRHGRQAWALLGVLRMCLWGGGRVHALLAGAFLGSSQPCSPRESPGWGLLPTVSELSGLRRSLPLCLI